MYAPYYIWLDMHKKVIAFYIKDLIVSQILQTVPLGPVGPPACAP